MTRLVAYDKGKYVDSITSGNPDDLALFRLDFQDYTVVEE